MRTSLSRSTFALVAALLPLGLSAQTMAAPAAVSVKIGDVAPEFTLPASTIKGVSEKPVTLASLKGKTVVLAFFPRARTGGCTQQMTTFRNQYEEIFGSGKAATLLAISNDSAYKTASWAKDSSFQFTFLADVNNDVAKAYGSISPSARPGSGDLRNLYVIGPDGKVASVTEKFNPNDPTAYTSLKETIAAVNKKK